MEQAQKKGGGTAGKVWDIAQPIAESFGLILWDIQFVKEGASWFLRIFIDKPEGVLIDDCEKISNAIDPILDEKDFIGPSYYLEVSSPGIERELKREEHFFHCVGQKIRVKLIRPMETQRVFEGELQSFTGDTVIMQTDSGDTACFPLKDIAKCNTVYDFS